MKKIFQLMLVAAMVSGFTAVSAHSNKQNHYCKMADGSMDMAKSKKECHKAKGKWVKDAAEKKEKAPTAK